MIKETLSLTKASKRFTVFVVIYILLSLLGMIFTPLFDEDEGFFAEAARQMLASGDYVTIKVNGQERYDKPALFFWVTAISLKVFGTNEVAARLPAFLFFLLNLILVYRFSKRHFSKNQAVMAVLIAISALQFQVLARATVSDNLLNLLVSLALFGFYEYQENPKNTLLFWIFTFAGFGFLTKGPIAFIIIFGVLFVFLVLIQNLQLLKKILNPIFIFWAWLIPLPWFYLAYQKSGDFLFTDFVIKHNFGRFSQTMESHGGHIWYYTPVLFLSFLPFSHLILSGFRAFKFNKKNLFLLIWFLLPFVLFSFSKTQLPHYISIGYVPLIILMVQTKSLKPTLVFFQILMLFALFLGAPIFAQYLNINDEFVMSMLSSTPLVFDKYYFWAMTILICLLIMAFVFLKDNIFHLAVIYCLGTTLFIHKYGLLQQGFVKETGITLGKNKSTIFMSDHYNPSLSFYAQRAIDIKENPRSGDTLFVKYNKKFKEVNAVISRKNGYLLLVKK